MPAALTVEERAALSVSRVLANLAAVFGNSQSPHQRQVIHNLAVVSLRHAAIAFRSKTLNDRRVKPLRPVAEWEYQIRRHNAWSPSGVGRPLLLHVNGYLFGHSVLYHPDTIHRGNCQLAVVLNRAGQVLPVIGADLYLSSECQISSPCNGRRFCNKAQVAIDYLVNYGAVHLVVHRTQ